MIAVVGATGRQGGAVARRLLREGVPVRALTRRPQSAPAQALARAGAALVRADLDHASSLRAAFDGVSGVFAVTEFWEHGYAGELQHGTNLITAAAEAGVEQLVFSSVGATERTAGLGITHFDAKRTIEDRLRQSGLGYTILRPVTFFENFVSQRYRRAICRRGVFRFAIRPELRFQMVALDDLAFFAARAFAEPARYLGRALEVASDCLTMTEFCAVLSAAVRRPVRYRLITPWQQRVVARYVELTRSSGHYKVGRSLIAQFAWNNASPTGGWDADLAALRAEHPGLCTAARWADRVDWFDGL
ncbi:NmrA/HSCARG family protein [Haliangium sp.]|uniref:NmrA/HSCARG family protein n=1 Tax=Haliangium sp. TaxID=2663208 RepID=UPI003D0FB3B4